MKKTIKTPATAISQQPKRKFTLDPKITANSYVAKNISAKDAFNLYNLNDIPPIIKKSIGQQSLRGIIKHMFIEVFKKQSVCSVDEIHVGIYRLFGIAKERHWITSNVSQLKSAGLIKNVPGQAGVFELVK